MDETISTAQVGGPDRFEISVDGAVAGFTRFVDDSPRLVRIFFHTVIAEAFGGRGLAGRVVSEALDQTRDAGLKVVPLCPYVKGYLAKHSEYADLAVSPTPADIELASRQPQL